jgi:phosphonate transport system substrate-binding protein
MLQRSRSVFAFATAIVGLLALAGCGQDNPYPQVALKKKVALAGVRQAAGQSLAQSHREPPLRVAIASILSPARNLESYHGLLAFLERRLGRPVQLVQRMTYAEVNDLMKTGQIDMAFVCSLPYIE